MKNPIYEQIALTDARILLLALIEDKLYGNKIEMLTKWANQIIKNYPPQNTIEEMWKSRVSEYIINRIKNKDVEND